MPKKIIDEEQVAQLEEDIYQFLSDWSPHINLDNDLVHTKVGQLAEAAIVSLADNIDTDTDPDNDVLQFDGTMDQYGFGDDDE